MKKEDGVVSLDIDGRLATNGRSMDVQAIGAATIYAGFTELG